MPCHITLTLTEPYISILVTQQNLILPPDSFTQTRTILLKAAEKSFFIHDVFSLVKQAVPLLCGLIYLHAGYISITSPDISPLPQCITHHLYLFTALISNFRPFLPSVGAVQSWYQPPLNRWITRCFNKTKLFFSKSYFTSESIQMKSCPYTFYHNKEGGFRQKSR